MLGIRISRKKKQTMNKQDYEHSTQITKPHKNIALGANPTFSPNCDPFTKIRPPNCPQLPKRIKKSQFRNNNEL